MFFLELTDGDIVKTEFTFFPFPRIELKQKFGQLNVDSLIDIAVNKIFTIYQKPRSRDFIDLYCILQKEKWTIVELVANAKIKFDHHIDLVQFGSQLLKSMELKDYPRMILKLEPEMWQGFFLEEAKKLSSEVLE